MKICQLTEELAIAFVPIVPRVCNAKLLDILNKLGRETTSPVYYKQIGNKILYCSGGFPNLHSYPLTWKYLEMRLIKNPPKEVL